MTTKTKSGSRNYVRNGDIMSFIYWGKVESVEEHRNRVVVQDLDDPDEKTFAVIGRELIDNAASADRFDKVVRVNKTKAAEMLVNSHGKPFTVVFTKANGTRRTLRGRLVMPEPLLGRSLVEDLDKHDESRVRQVDHRTIETLIIDNVKYIVK